MRKATVSQVKEHNQRLVLRALYGGTPTSRAALAQQTRLTRPTISQIVRELLVLDLAREEGPGESSGGKPPTLLSFNDHAYHVIGLHIGGRHTFGVVTDLRGCVVSRASRPTDLRSSKYALQGVFCVLDDLRARTQRPLLGMGISTPGLVDHLKGIVRYSANLDWQDVPVGDRLSSHYGDQVPIYVDNDTNLAALGERAFGAGDGVDNMVILMIGTRGIGAGMIMNGEIYHGTGGGAGEIGHTPVTDNCAPCSCGRQGCLEAVASGWALVGRAKEAIEAYPDSRLSAIAAEALRFEDIQQALLAGDRLAADLAREAGHYTGLAVATLISTVNPQRVVIGGSVPELGEPFFSSLLETVEKKTLPLLLRETEIVPVSLGNDVNVLGAVAQVLVHELGVV